MLLVPQRHFSLAELKIEKGCKKRAARRPRKRSKLSLSPFPVPSYKEQERRQSRCRRERDSERAFARLMRNWRSPKCSFGRAAIAFFSLPLPPSLGLLCIPIVASDRPLSFRVAGRSGRITFKGVRACIYARTHVYMYTLSCGRE